MFAVIYRQLLLFQLYILCLHYALVISSTRLCYRSLQFSLYTRVVHMLLTALCSLSCCMPTRQTQAYKRLFLKTWAGVESGIFVFSYLQLTTRQNITFAPMSATLCSTVSLIWGPILFFVSLLFDILLYGRSVFIYI